MFRARAVILLNLRSSLRCCCPKVWGVVLILASSISWQKNLLLNLGLLVAPMKYYQKIFSVGALENPVYAIALKDQMGNHFIFRRKANYPLFGERELQIKLQEISNQYDHEISVEMKRIDEDLTKKIKNWTVGKEDIEPLFQHIEDPLIPTEKEIELLRALREPNADPQRIIKDFLKK